MAVPRDPNFWKRFSLAVHQDEEASIDEKGLKETNQWLQSTQKKNKRSYACFCYAFWALLAGFVAAVVIVVLVLVNNGTFERIHIGEGEKIDVGKLWG